MGGGDEEEGGRRESPGLSRALLFPECVRNFPPCARLVEASGQHAAFLPLHSADAGEDAGRSHNQRRLLPPRPAAPAACCSRECPLAPLFREVPAAVRLRSEFSTV